MLFATPKLSRDLERRLEVLDQLRASLGARVGTPTPWIGKLGRQVRAESAESSIAIEGFEVPEAEIVDLVAGRTAPDPEDANRMALTSYARAMEHVAVMAGDPGFRWYDRVLLDLHFDACSFQRDKRPGRWRDHPIGVTSLTGNGMAYVAPDEKAVPKLMGEVVAWLQKGDLDVHQVVRAAMAHLHVVSVHPFSDGNGRLSRVVQSLVLARDGMLAPEFGSIEEHLSQNTPTYYSVLEEVQGGSYQPDRDATPWIDFCVAAHFGQVNRRMEQLETAARRWQFLEELAGARGWPDRLVIALEQSLFGGAERAAYAAQADISLPTASGDLRRLVDAGLVTQQGRTRSTRYMATDLLHQQLRRALAGYAGVAEAGHA
ncbi:MAG TPA: Fic family protein [Baekduia sp.]|uniref:Fic family protein n=1 Tax=Baekduia sp. TaxID=2600305 RepID=UPI002C004CA5|nr:Fic family protein [Baekduia sp.]HMJ35163.1 Fic family protein [Baekduia sp.]